MKKDEAREHYLKYKDKPPPPPGGPHTLYELMLDDIRLDLYLRKLQEHPQED